MSAVLGTKHSYQGMHQSITGLSYIASGASQKPLQARDASDRLLADHWVWNSAFNNPGERTRWRVG